jgi:hypothetical protein
MAEEIFGYLAAVVTSMDRATLLEFKKQCVARRLEVSPAIFALIERRLALSYSVPDSRNEK